MTFVSTCQKGFPPWDARIAREPKCDAFLGLRNSRESLPILNVFCFILLTITSHQHHFEIWYMLSSAANQRYLGTSERIRSLTSQTILDMWWDILSTSELFNHCSHRSLTQQSETLDMKIARSSSWRWVPQKHHREGVPPTFSELEQIFNRPYRVEIAIRSYSHNLGSSLSPRGIVPGYSVINEWRFTPLISLPKKSSVCAWQHTE
jgi:hypothetical protein